MIHKYITLIYATIHNDSSLAANLEFSFEIKMKRKNN